MKTECIIKSLITDFKNVIDAIGLLSGALLVYYICTNTVPVLSNILKEIGAVNSFIVFGILFIILGFIVNTIPPKEFLIKNGTTWHYAVSVALVLFVYFWYCLLSFDQHMFKQTPFYPDVNLICAIYIIISIVLTPFALAYVRCKE